MGRRLWSALGIPKGSVGYFPSWPKFAATPVQAWAFGVTTNMTVLFPCLDRAPTG